MLRNKSKYKNYLIATNEDGWKVIYGKDGEEFEDYSMSFETLAELIKYADKD